MICSNWIPRAQISQVPGTGSKAWWMSPTWHLRLFRGGSARCEMRKDDQHFYLCEGSLGRLQGYLVDDVRMPLSEWTARHNRWSDAEVDELTVARSSAELIQARIFGNPIEQKRYWRKLVRQTSTANATVRAVRLSVLLSPRLS